MRFIFLIICLSALTVAHTQDTVAIREEKDTSISFFGTKPLNLYGYENRVIPYGSKNPLHVIVTYPDSKITKLEYFRIDSANYLVYEYFRDGKMSSNDGIKSRGVKTVKNNIIGKSTTTVMHAGAEEGERFSREIHYYKEFSKEGEWEEYEDSVFNHIYWTGNYKNNKRTGVWKRIVYGIGDDLVLEEIDYDKDSTRKIYTTNIINAVTKDSLTRFLIGRWSLRNCDSEKEPRMFYSKCETYGGEYGDDCNNNIDRNNYYDFVSKTRFVRQRGEGCYKFRESSVNAAWSIVEKKGQYYIELKFTNGQVWQLKILYLDNENNLVTDRM